MHHRFNFHSFLVGGSSIIYSRAFGTSTWNMNSNTQVVLYEKLTVTCLSIIEHNGPFLADRTPLLLIFS